MTYGSYQQTQQSVSDLSKRKGVGELSSTPPLITERSTMNNHSHKEPPLRNKVNHISRLKSNFAYYVSLVCFAIVMGLVIGQVFE